MNSDERILQVFSKFHTFRRETADSFVTSRVMRHSDYVLPETFHGSKSMVFSSMADDFTCGLIGEVNRFLVGVHHADCWVRAAAECEKGERLGLLWEFAEPHLELAVGRPYSLKNQFIFAVVHLAHQANLRRDASLHDVLPSDRQIDFNALAKVDRGWISFPKFLKKLDQLNNPAFTKATNDFRHRLQHRFRLHFDTGLRNYFERTQTKTGTSYAYKAIRPLRLEILIPELYEEHKRATDLFGSYWGLLQELCTVWEKPDGAGFSTHRKSAKHSAK